MNEFNGARECIAQPLIAMTLAIIALFALGWGAFFWFVLPGGYPMPGGGVFGTGLAMTAFTLAIMSQTCVGFAANDPRESAVS